MTFSHFAVYNIYRQIFMEKRIVGSVVDSVTRSRERRKLMMEMLERKIRLRARQLYEERGQIEGRELEDWVRAESEVLQSSILAPLWNKRQERELAEARITALRAAWIDLAARDGKSAAITPPTGSAPDQQY
jgi:hypothetical protein